MMTSESHSPREHAAQVRTLETVIRLSSAAAKARLSGQVETVDVDVATGLMDYVLKSDKTADGAARLAPMPAQCWPISSALLPFRLESAREPRQAALCA